MSENLSSRDEELRALPVKREVCGDPCFGHDRTDHIPPPGVRGGSAFLELGHELKGAGQAGPGPRPERVYVDVPSADEQYGVILLVRVLTTKSECWSYFEYDFTDSGGYDPQLHLWLHGARGGNAPEDDFPPIPVGAEPQIVVKGNVPDNSNNGWLTMRVDSRRRIRENHEPTHQHSRKHRYSHSHPGGGTGKDFRIGKWQLVDTAGKPIPADFGGVAASHEAEAFQFMIYFADPVNGHDISARKR